MKRLLVVALILVGCAPDTEEVRNAIDNQGFTDIQVGDPAYFACGEDDGNGGRYFSAKNSNGKTVHGVVCCGWSKGCTIRW
jgi:hypothetical protein